MPRTYNRRDRFLAAIGGVVLHVGILAYLVYHGFPKQSISGVESISPLSWPRP